MKCKKVVSLISDYVDGCLGVCAAGELEAHVNQCPICAEHLRSTQSLLGGLRSLCECSCPTDCWESVRHAVVVHKHAPGQPAWFLRPLFAVPSLAVALLVCVLLWPRMVTEPTQSAVTMPEYSHYIAAHSGAQRQQALTDPDVAFACMELERANLSTADNKR